MHDYLEKNKIIVGLIFYIFPAYSKSIQRFNMLQFLFTLLGWFFSFWNGLSNETKTKIIETIVSTFEVLFKNFYQQTKKNWAI